MMVMYDTNIWTVLDNTVLHMPEKPQPT
uniref:Uncharacterized protein n=1 Tax=Arundo donax TaxID=35708 RepID=A0A0A9A2B5_ARUDO